MTSPVPFDLVPGTGVTLTPGSSTLTVASTVPVWDAEKTRDVIGQTLVGTGIEIITDDAGDKVRLTVNTGTSTGTASFGPMTLDDIKVARGENWYGMEDGLRGPTLAELQAYKARGYTMIRLPTRWQTTNAEIEAVLAAADQAKIWIGVVTHNYGRIGGTASITATDGTVITSANQSQWFDYAVAQCNAFKHHPSYVPLDMNEPSQNGTTWEPISAGRVAALRASGYTGIIGVSAAFRSSAGGINNVNEHPGGWWITDPNSFLEVHHYLSPLSDASSLDTRAELDNWVVTSSGQTGITTYNQYVDRAFNFGIFGTASWNTVPILIGEFAMFPGMETELNTYLNKVDARGVGAIQWAGGMWSTNYKWKITDAQRAVMSTHVKTPPASGGSASVTSAVEAPSQYGHLGWTNNPIYAANQGQPTSGRIYFNRFRASVSGACTAITYKIVVAGSGLTSGQNFVALYDTGQTTAGVATRLGISADQTTAWASTGTIKTTITPSVTLTAGQDYFIAILSVGTTPPNFIRAGSYSDIVNQGLTGLGLRAARSAAGGNTSLPTTFATANLASTPDFSMFTMIAED